MGDNKLLDTNQIVNGLAVLLSFFVGYKYALKRHDIKENEADKKAGEEQGAAGSSETKDEPVSFIFQHGTLNYYINFTCYNFSFSPVLASITKWCW